MIEDDRVFVDSKVGKTQSHAMQLELLHQPCQLPEAGHNT